MLRSVHLCVCNGTNGEERSSRNRSKRHLPLLPTDSSHTTAKIQLRHISMGLASVPKSLQRNRTAAAAGRGAVKPAHQDWVFCSCRNLHKGLAWRTPCPMLHTEETLLLFCKKRSGECKCTALMVEVHSIHYHHKWKHQVLLHKPKCRGAGGKCFCH